MTLSQMALSQVTIYHVKAGITIAVVNKVADFTVDNYAAHKVKHPQRETCSVPDPTTSLIDVMGLLNSFRDGNDLNLRQLDISDAVLLVCRCRVRDTSSPAIWATIWRLSHERKKCRPNRLIKLIN